MTGKRAWALNSAVECHLHTVEVIGSNPIAPTIIGKSKTFHRKGRKGNAEKTESAPGRALGHQPQIPSTNDQLPTTCSERGKTQSQAFLPEWERLYEGK